MNICGWLLDSFFLPASFEDSSRSREKCDCVTPQSFGRNSYPEDGFLFRIGNRIRRKFGKKELLAVGAVGTLRDSVADDISAFQKLHEHGFDPGRSNRILAETCVGLAVRNQRCHVVGQWEVLKEMHRLFPTWYALNQSRLVALWPSRKGYLGTRGLLVEVKRVMKERDLTRVCVVAHPEHMPRVYFLALKIFGKPVATMTDVMSEEWFDPDSVQWWTRGKWRWLGYEMLVRIHHRIHGWF